MEEDSLGSPFSSKHRLSRSPQHNGLFIDKAKEVCSQPAFYSPALSTPGNTNDVTDTPPQLIYHFQDTNNKTGHQNSKRKLSSVTNPEQPEHKTIQEQNSSTVRDLYTYLLTGQAKQISKPAIEAIMRAARKLEDNCNQLIIENARLTGEVEALRGQQHPRKLHKGENEDTITLESLKSTIEKTVADQIKKLSTPPFINRTSYAEAASNEPPKPQRPRGAVLLTQTEENKSRFPTIDSLKKSIKESIVPANEGIRVRNMIQTTKGILIQTQTIEGAQKIANSAKIKDLGVDTKIPSKRLPRLIIYDVPAHLNEASLAETFWKQNARAMDKTKQTFKPIFKNGPRNTDNVNWVVEVSPNVRNEVRKEGRVYFEWSSCNARDWLGITRCFKCQGLGHSAKFCRGETIYCPFCAQSGHNLETCPNEKAGTNPKCINCDRANAKSDHPATSKDCPSYQKAIDRLRSATTYEDNE